MRPILGCSHWGRESPFVTRPSSSGELLLVGTWDGWCTGSVVADKLSVTLPVWPAPVLSHCSPWENRSVTMYFPPPPQSSRKMFSLVVLNFAEMF